MAQTPLGHFQRTQNGRFLYGRCNNYRLKSALASMPNPNLDLGSTDLDSGASPLTVSHDVAAGVGQTSIVADQRENWPSSGSVNGAGTSQVLTQGGIAARTEGFPRVDNNGVSSISETQDWIYDDGDPADTGVGFGSNTSHDYTSAGTFRPDLSCKDGLGRESLQEEVEEIVVT